ncbi:subunit 17 of mediator complex-domain-containing protein [Coniella lustricola]|uniref:Mediator of RNA polymerase II transcription subunit 17 n=1 Tax=Coniella lustricola TaxID=2025994 RepID=A0A2T3AC06_9PEZI|nr:subunit 17 of mediator complex-domain-containing protein [Coniella lustricola]
MSSSSFALGPLALGDRRPQNLSDFIQRVNAERGGFRNITEESLREEAEADANGVLDSKEVDMLDDKAQDIGSGHQPSPEEFQTAISKVYQQAEVAHQNAMLALDFLSLLLTKEDSPQAGASLSPALRELVGTGVLGVDKLAKSNMTEARLQDHKAIATGWKLANIDKTVDSLLSSASRLQKEMTVEAKYWEEVLAVSDKGWAITHVSNELQDLGVRYGFSEAAPTFRKTSLAPMRRSDDGSVDLDCGALLGESKRLRVTLEERGKIVGRSALPEPLPQDAPLEDRVLEARNTIFAQELWHELDREGRLFPAYGISIEEGVLSYTYAEQSKVVIQLEPLTRSPDQEPVRPLPGDHHAEALSAILHQMLTYAHRVNNSKRSRSNPRNRKAATRSQPYQLVRPLLAYTKHGILVNEATNFISGLVTILQSAGFSTAMFKLTESPIAPDFATANHSIPEALITYLLRPLECQFEVNITPDVRILIHCRTAMRSAILPTFHIYPLPIAPGTPSPLHRLYPPSEFSNHEGYGLADLKYYLQEAVTRVLVDRAAAFIPPVVPSTSQTSGELEANWIRQSTGKALKNVNDEREEVSIEVVNSGTATGGQQLELRVAGSWNAGQAVPGRRVWIWTVQEAVEGLKHEGFEGVVKSILSREAPSQLD